jgi:hypothetical protein
MLGVPAPIESAVVASRDFTWDVPVELISSDAWAQQMAVDEESHVAVTLAGAAAPVVLLPLRLASLMGRERSNTTQIAVDSSALGQTPVLMSSIFVTITRDSDMLSPALMDRLNPLAITIVRCAAPRSSVVASRACLRRSAPAACPTRPFRTSSCALPASQHTSSEPLQLSRGENACKNVTLCCRFAFPPSPTADAGAVAQEDSGACVKLRTNGQLQARAQRFVKPTLRF